MTGDEDQDQPADLAPQRPQRWLIVAGVVAVAAALGLRAVVVAFPFLPGWLGAWYAQAAVVVAAVAVFFAGRWLVGRAYRRGAG